MREPPPGCWDCGTVPSAEDTARGALLRSRSEADGGPWMRLPCPACGAEAALERRADGLPVLAPPAAVGEELPPMAALWVGARGRARARRAAAWVARHGAAFHACRAARRRERPPAGAAHAPADPPRRRPRPASGGRAGPPREPPPRPAPAPAFPGTELPADAAAARAVLGVPAGAPRSAVEAAFRAAARRCHPDLVAHLDPDFRALAHAKFLRLRRARDLLAPGRG
jgi:hypothetical protein